MYWCSREIILVMYGGENLMRIMVVVVEVVIMVLVCVLVLLFSVGW